MRALDPHTLQTRLEFQITPKKHASNGTYLHYSTQSVHSNAANTVVSSVTRFKVLVMYFAEILNTEGRTVSRRAFVTATLDEGNGLASRSGRRYPMDRWLCGLRRDSTEWRTEHISPLEHRAGFVQSLLHDRQAQGKIPDRRSYRMAVRKGKCLHTSTCLA